MKISILIFVIPGFMLTSCMKSKTCTCKDPSGEVVEQETKTGSKGDLKEFEENCKNKKIETLNNGVVVSSIPCEITN